MPGPHRRFLEAVSRVANLRAFITTRASDPKLQGAYDSCLKALYLLRDKHIRIVSRYIILPSQQKSLSVPPELLESVHANSTLAPPMSLRGTGGTNLIPFLKQTRDETWEHARDSS